MADQILRGTVTRLNDIVVGPPRTETGLPHVEVPDLGVGYDFGPLPIVAGLSLQKGDRVLVTSVSGIREDLIVIAKLA